MHVRLSLIIWATALACSVAAAPAQAQRARTFVASYGSDVNNTTCNFVQPCKTFQNAYNNTAVGGEVTAIDSAGFGALGINHSITITSPTGVEAGIVPSSGADAIDIGAGPTDVVVLRGLTLEGGGGLNGGAAVNFSAGGTLEILDCAIKDFFDGVLVKPTSGTTQVVIKNTTVLNNGNAGIYITPHQSANVAATLSQVTADLNAYGIYFDASQTSGGVYAIINNSQVTNNSTYGIVFNASANNPPSFPNVAYVTNTTSIGNSIGAAFINAGDVILNGAMTAYFSTSKLIFMNGTAAVAYSDGTNFIVNNLGSIMIGNIGTH